MTTGRQIRLALRAYGVGGPGQHNLWKDPRVPRNASIDIDWYIAQAKAAEHAAFDALFIVDSQFIDATYPPHYLNRLEPLTLLSAVATHTRTIGLVGTLSSTYNSPFNVARRFASLDHISGGRAGWNVVTSLDSGTSRNYGLDEHLDYTTRYAARSNTCGWCEGCGTPTRTAPSPARTCSSTQPSCTRSTTRASTSGWPVR